MAIIYSYPDNENLLLTDMLIGTSTIRVNGRKKNITKNFTLESLGMFISENFPAANIAWGDITGNLSNQTDLQDALDAKQANITLTTTGTSGLATFIGNTLNIPDYGSGYVTPTLQSVTDVGNTTTNFIEVIDSYVQTISSTNPLIGAALSSSGFISIGNGTVFTYLSSDITNLNVYFKLPNKVSGTYTLATTADIPSVTGFVPYTGATQNVDIGIYDYIGSNITLNGLATDGGAVNISQGATATIAGNGYSSITAQGTDKLSFYLANGFDGKQFNLLTNSITLNDTLNYTLPSTSGTIALTSDITGSVTSVGLSMPSAFTVTNSPVTSSGTLTVTGAGTVSQYVRGDGSLANFPNSTGGGSSVNYYLNGSISQGTFGGDTYYEMSRTPILGAGTNFVRTNGAGNGYIASFITDAGDPSQLNIPGGNWNVEFYFQSSSPGGTPSFYAELYKVDVSNNFTLIASGSANPEGITNGTTVDQYFSSIPVPQTTLLITDRLAIRIFVNTGGRTITLHTEDGNLCEVLTTFTTGLTALNGLTAQVQSFATGTSGTDFAISSATATHTFNLPTASAANRGALSSTDWSTFNGKQAALVSGTNIKTINGNSVLGSGDLAISGSNIYNANGTLTGNRTVTSGGFTLTFTSNVQTGLLGVNRAFASNVGLYLKGSGATSTTFNLLGTDSAGNNLYTFLDDGTLCVGSITKVGTSKVQVTGNVSILGGGNFYELNNALGAGIKNNSGDFYIDAIAASANTYFRNGSSPTERMRIVGSTGNVLINTTTDAGFKLDVNGTARVQNRLTLQNNYTVGNSFNSARLGIVSSNSANSFLDLYPQNVTGGSDVGFTIWSKGSISNITNYEILEFRYDNANRRYSMNSISAGTGTILPISLYTGANTNQLNLFTSGNVCINTSTDVASSQLTVESTTKGFLPPRMTTTQKNAIATPAAGLVVYDTTLNKLCVRTASSWETITSI